MGKPVKPKNKLNINPTTGKLDLVTDNNFSYESVPVNKKLKIRNNEQMIVHQEFLVEGELKLEGTLVII